MSGLAQGQPELTGDASKPQSQWYLLPHHPWQGVAIPGKPAQFTITDEDDNKDHIQWQDASNWNRARLGQGTGGAYNQIFSRSAAKA